MSDRYLDLPERGIYGETAVRRIGRYVARTAAAAGDDPHWAAQQGILEQCGTMIGETTGALAAALEGAADADAGIHDLSRAKSPVLAEAWRLVGALFSHLEELEKRGATFDWDRLFVGGTVGGAGRSAAAALLAVGRAISGCRYYEERQATLAARRAELEALLPRLTSAVEDAAEAHGDRSTATPEVQAASAAWLSVYRASKLIAEGVLLLRGEVGLLRYLFHDLAVPAGTRLREAPADEPPPEPPRPPT